jgi:hypothetical protein
MADIKQDHVAESPLLGYVFHDIKMADYSGIENHIGKGLTTCKIARKI